MIITVGKLRHIIREQIERNMRWTAGMYGGGQNGGAEGGNGVVPPPGLGSEKQEDNGKEKSEELEQQGAKARRRQARLDGATRHDRRSVAGNPI